MLAALDGKARCLTQTVFELAAAAPAEEAGLLRRLRAAGVFLEGRPRGVEPAGVAARAADDDALE